MPLFDLPDRYEANQLGGSTLASCSETPISATKWRCTTQMLELRPAAFSSRPHDQGALLKLVIWFQIRQGLLDAKIGPFIMP
jgi:hypothetical protein